MAIGGANALVIVNNSGTPTTQIDVDCDEAVLLNDGGTPLRVSAVNITINAATTGANALDTGSLANNTWYYVFIISNGTTTAGLLSASATAPTMPSGYTYKYRVGAVKTGGSATFLRTKQVGNRTQYVVVSGSTTPNLPIMASGAAGDPELPTWVAIAVGSYVPPTASCILGVGVQSLLNAGFIVAPNNAYGEIADATNPPPVGGWADVPHVPFCFVLESTNIYWAGKANSSVAARGWIDSVNAS